MKLLFLIAFETNPYSGAMRPFINWQKDLKKKYTIEYALLQCGEKVEQSIKTLGFRYTSFSKAEDLYIFCKGNTFAYIVGDDSFERLKILVHCKKASRSKIVVYAQVLFALKSVTQLTIVNPTTLLSRLVFPFMSYIPFSLFVKMYKKLLQNADIVIANSQTTANLLYSLYGIQVQDRVYPPIDLSVFTKDKSKKEKAAFLYLGSYAGDTDEKLVEKIIQSIIAKKYSIYLFGNNKLQQKMRELYPQIKTLFNVADKQLREVYNKCLITITPQEFELCGYVPLESMACGTPVVSYGYLGPGETVINGGTGIHCLQAKDFPVQCLRLLSDKKRGEMGAAGRKRVESLYIKSIVNIL